MAYVGVSRSKGYFKYVTVSLLDEATGEQNHIRVTAEEAEKMREDPEYAQQVYSEFLIAGCSNEATEEQLDSFDNEASLLESDEVPLSNIDSSPSEEAEGMNRWSHSAVLLLVNEYEQHITKFESPRFTSKAVWGLIADCLKKHGLTFNGHQCDTKWRGLKKIYKKIKDHNNKSGNNRKPWAYFSVMDDLLGKKPDMAPVLTASSSGAVTGNAVYAEEEEEDEEGDGAVPTGSVVNNGEERRPRRKLSTSKKQTLADIYADMKADRAKRHAEKMAARKEMMKLMKDLCGGDNNDKE